MTPGGHIGREFQEYVRCVLLLKAAAACKRQQLEYPTVYRHLCRDLDWKDRDGECIMFSWDDDRRHTFSDFLHYKATCKGKRKGELLDRRDYKKGKHQWIQLLRKQMIPSAQKVQETIQQPIECTFSAVKARSRKQLGPLAKVQGQELVQAAGDSVAAVEPESVKGAFRNAEQAIRAWACPVGTSITVKVKRARFTVPGTGGGRVHKRLRH